MKTSNLIHKSSLLIGLVGILLLTSCYQSRVAMNTIIEGDGHGNFKNHNFREITYSNVMSQEMRDSLWGEGKPAWSQPMPECLNIAAFCSSETEVGEGDTVTTIFWCPFETVEKMCVGEIGQAVCRYREDVTAEEYLRNIHSRAELPAKILPELLNDQSPC